MEYNIIGTCKLKSHLNEYDVIEFSDKGEITVEFYFENGEFESRESGRYEVCDGRIIGYLSETDENSDVPPFDFEILQLSENTMSLYDGDEQFNYVKIN